MDWEEAAAGAEIAADGNEVIVDAARFDEDGAVAEGREDREDEPY